MMMEAQVEMLTEEVARLKAEDLIYQEELKLKGGLISKL
jgi:uncharacterized small protein (DUF1192 family)